MPRKLSLAYIPALDGMRGISILLVFIAHIGFERIIPGGLGVTVFFFISGYIITLVLIHEYQKNNHINLKLFYTGRLLRLYPPLLFMLTLVIPYLIFTHHHLKASEISACLLYYENYYFFYTGRCDLTLSILWSLAVEEHFYIIYPFIFAYLYKYTSKLITLLIILMAAALGLRILGYMRYASSPDDLERYCYVLTHTRFDSILFGCLTSVILKSYRADSFRRLLSNKGIFILAVIIQVICLVVRDNMFRYTLRYTLQGMSFFILVPAVINTQSYHVFKQILSSRLLVFIGKMSYSIYLLHMFVINTLLLVFRPGVHPYAYYISCILGTAILSLFTYTAIEKPIYKFRKRHVVAKVPVAVSGNSL